MKWINIVQTEQKPKTKVWTVVTKEHSLSIGQIQWFGKWRKYAFFPLAETVFEPDCLRDIAAFIQAEMDKRKKTKYGKSPLEQSYDAILQKQRCRQSRHAL